MCETKPDYLITYTRSVPVKTIAEQKVYGKFKKVEELAFDESCEIANAHYRSLCKDETCSNIRFYECYLDKFYLNI